MNQCNHRKHKDYISECYTLSCLNANVRRLWSAFGTKVCGTFTIKALQTCGNVSIVVNHLNFVGSISEGESITLTLSDIEVIAVICEQTGGAEGNCKIEFTFQPNYVCC